MKPLRNNWYCAWSEFLSYSSVTHIRWMEISLNMETRQWKNSTRHFEAISESRDKVLHTLSSSVFEPRYLLNHYVFEWVTSARGLNSSIPDNMSWTVSNFLAPFSRAQLQIFKNNLNLSFFIYFKWLFNLQENPNAVRYCTFLDLKVIGKETHEKGN